MIACRLSAAELRDPDRYDALADSPRLLLELVHDDGSRSFILSDTQTERNHQR